MLAKDYFTLRLIRLSSSEDWSFNQDGLCLLFPKGGAGKFGDASVAQRLLPGDVFVLTGGAAGKLNVANGGDMVFWCFSLRLEHLYPLFASSEFSLLEGVVDSFKATKLLSASSPLAKQCHQLIEEIPPQFNLDHRIQLLRVVAVILAEEFKKAHHQRIGSLGIEEHMMQVFEKMPVDELLSLSVGELAGKFGCSRRHLNRLFHQYFGSSVAALRMEMRLLKAVSLLRDKNAKIINVAEQCGFNHLGLFNTCFKRRFGVSPGQWRKQNLPGEIQPGSMEADGGVCPLRSKGLCPWVGAQESGVSEPLPSPPLPKSSSEKVLPNMPKTDKQTTRPSLTIQPRMRTEPRGNSLLQVRR